VRCATRANACRCSLVTASARSWPDLIWSAYSPTPETPKVTRSSTGLGRFVTPLNRQWLQSVPSEIDQLLGRVINSELEAGRASILVCDVCGDLGCGAVTVRLSVADDPVTRSEWAIENGRSQPEPIDVLGPVAVLASPLRNGSPRRLPKSLHCPTTSRHTMAERSCGRGNGAGGSRASPAPTILIGVLRTTRGNVRASLLDLGSRDTTG
jgi:hypothetical protein